MGKIAALILAAGESERMNTPKMILPFDGKTIVEKVIENVISSVVDKTFVVLGADNDKIVEIIKKYPVTYCYNDDYKNGMLSSVQCGFRSIPPGYEAVLVFLGDQPMISPDVTDAIIGAFRQTNKGIVVPVCNKKRGHPILVSFEYYMEIENLETDKGLRFLAQKFPEAVHEVETSSVAILKDIDTPEDYQIQKNQIQ